MVNVRDNMDKIYWYNGFSGIAEKTNIIINLVEKVETKDLEPGLWRNIYKVHYRASNLGEFIMWIGTKGTGIELNGAERYIVDDSGELDIIGVNTYLYNRKMMKVLDNL